jgi:hypothetical protein
MESTQNWVGIGIKVKKSKSLAQENIDITGHFFLTQNRRSSPYSLIEGEKLYNGIARESVNYKQNLCKRTKTKILCSQL